MVGRKEERLNQLVRVKLKDRESFSAIKNLLRRIGINPSGTKNLFQTCHILRHGNDFYICHFKELFWVDGREDQMTQVDRERRNKIISILAEKGLIEVNVSNLTYGNRAAKTVFIVPYPELNQWSLHPKYRFKKTLRIKPLNATLN
jgi:hypothetical protein